MTATFRINLAFDLTIHDEEKARAAAAEILRNLTRRTEEQGGHAETERGESPEVAAHGLAQNPEAVALVLAPEVVINAAEHISWLSVANFEGRIGTAQ